MSDLGYDQTDLFSFPYQANDPPFDASRLVIEDLDRAAQVDVMEVLAAFSMYDDDGPAEYRTLDMALRLFAKCVSTHTFEGIAFPDIFGACLDQAMIWERG